MSSSAMRRARQYKKWTKARWIAPLVIGSSLVPVLGTSSASAAVATPNQVCSQSSSYSVGSTVGKVMNRMGPVYSDYNGTPYSESATFTETQGGTSTYSISVGGSFDLDLIIAGAQGTTSWTLSQSWSVGTGNNVTITVPSHQTGNGEYGNWRWENTGTYYTYNAYCQVSSSTKITTLLPTNHNGWVTWNS